MWQPNNFNDYLTRLRFIDQAMKPFMLKDVKVSNIQVKEENTTIKDFKVDTTNLQVYLSDLNKIINHPFGEGQMYDDFTQEAKDLYDTIALYLRRVQVMKTNLHENIVEYMVKIMTDYKRPVRTHNRLLN